MATDTSDVTKARVCEQAERYEDMAEVKMIYFNCSA